METATGTGRCLKCGSTHLSKPKMVLMVGPCGQEICSDCRNIIYRMGNDHPCPGCGASFTKDDWEPKLFTGAVHVDVRVRRRELRQFNLQRKDFAAGPEGQRRYDDYLEMVEDFAYNLSNNLDTEQTRRDIQAFVAEHADLIKRNNARLIDERKRERLAKDTAAVGNSQSGGILQRLGEQEEQKRLDVAKRREEFLDGLASSANASVELARFQHAEAARIATAATGTAALHPATDEAVFQDFGRSRQQQPGDDGTSASLYRYEPSPQDWLGPPIPPTPEIRSRRLEQYTLVCTSGEEYAAGCFPPAMAVHRALAEAYSCLYLF